MFGLQVSVGVCGLGRDLESSCVATGTVFPLNYDGGFFRNGLQRFAGEYALLSFEMISSDLFVVIKGKTKLFPLLLGFQDIFSIFPNGYLSSAQKRNKGAFF